MNDFRRLEVWRESLELAEHVYRLTEAFPASERWGLTAQLRRAATSVSSNIAEGAGRGSNREFRRFLTIARGSLFEVDSQLEIASRLGVSVDQRLFDRATRLRRRLTALMATLSD